MRVIAGKARRLILKSTPGFDTRPTLDKIKETLFNILQPDIPGSRFLDLFSGSGSIGIEALSRGASSCVFVENNRKAAGIIHENLRHTRLEDDAQVMAVNVLSAINELSLKHRMFDIVYIDPPYSAGYEANTLSALAQSGIVDDTSIVIIETGIHNDLGYLEDSGFTVTRLKEYKTNRHVFLQLKGKD